MEHQSHRQTEPSVDAANKKADDQRDRILRATKITEETDHPFLGRECLVDDEVELVVDDRNNDIRHQRQNQEHLGKGRRFDHRTNLAQFIQHGRLLPSRCRLFLQQVAGKSLGQFQCANSAEHDKTQG